MDKERLNFSVAPVHQYQLSSSIQGLVRLRDILETGTGTSEHMSLTKTQTPVYALNGMDKRYLAVCLASTAMQLFRTPWLPPNWDNNQIFFARELNGSGRPLIREPLLSHDFSTHRPLESLPQAQKVPGYRLFQNKVLFDLAVILIELCFGSLLSSLRSCEDLGPEGIPNAFTDFLTASRLAKQVGEKEGTLWAAAVRHCMNCEFDHQKDAPSGSEAFRQAMFQGVVLPLEEELKYFCGGKLPSFD